MKNIIKLAFLALIPLAVHGQTWLPYDLAIQQFDVTTLNAPYTALNAPAVSFPGDIDGIAFFDSSTKGWYGVGIVGASVDKVTRTISFTGPTRVFNNAASRTLVTTAAAANGFQLSTTRDCSVNYTATISVTASIAGAGTGYVVMEICPTNSAVAANWIEVARFGNSQSFSLAITLAGVQALNGQIGGMVPAGYYARLRQVTVTGTVTFGTTGTGQEVQL